MNNIVFITDENYIIPTKTVINSIIQNATNEIIINIIGVNISEKSRTSILSLQSNNIIIKVLAFDNQFVDLGLNHHYVSKAALFKFKLAEIFSDLNEILYLDGDMICNPGFEKIFNYDITQYYAAAVQDMLAVELYDFHRKIGHEKYFNSGMMYINLKKWREDKISDRLIEYKKNDLDNSFMDQNALNAIIGNNILWISPQYNYMTSCTIDTFEELYKDGNALNHISQFYNISPGEMQKIIDKPAILHVTDQKKVWKDITANRIDEWIPYVLSDDYLIIAKNYCSTQAGFFSQKLFQLRNEIKEEINLVKYENEKQNAMIAYLKGNNNIFSYKLGNKISFNSIGNAIFYMVSGFYERESWGCWTTDRAEMKFNINADKDLSLDISYAVLEKQLVRIFVNDNLIAEYNAVEERKKMTIPKEIIQNNDLLLRFEIPNAKSPKEKGLNNDTRKIGLGFKSLIINC